MKKTVLIFIAALSAGINIAAQTNTNGQSNTAIAGINIPAGEFSKTHIAGISLGYSWSHHRFGKLEALPKKIIGFTANGSMDYYFGKKEIVAGYHYRYRGYINLHAFGGIIYNPFKKGNITLTTGPAMGIYKNSTDFGFGLRLDVNYYFTNAIGIMPGIIFLKHTNATAIWVIAIRFAYCF
jgi:hypothetical protein